MRVECNSAIQESSVVDFNCIKIVSALQTHVNFVCPLWRVNITARVFSAEHRTVAPRKLKACEFRITFIFFRCASSTVYEYLIFAIRCCASNSRHKTSNNIPPEREKEESYRRKSYRSDACFAAGSLCSIFAFHFSPFFTSVFVFRAANSEKSATFH